MVYKLQRKVFAAMQSHAEDSYPNECCGLLGGNEQLFSDYYPLTNQAETPINQFFAAPEEIFQVMQQMRRAGQQELGIYHSHPVSQPYPSARDIELAFYPEAINFIISLQPVRKLCAFRIIDGNVTVVDYVVIN